MNEKKQKILCSMLLAIGIAAIALQIFVFQKPDGTAGFILCLISVYLIIGASIWLCRLEQINKT